MKMIALKETSIYRQEIRQAVDAGQAFMMGVLTLLLRNYEENSYRVIIWILVTGRDVCEKRQGLFYRNVGSYGRWRGCLV